MVRRSPVGVTLVIAALALTAACGSSSSGESGGSSVKVGTVLSLTGPVAAYGIPEKEGIELAIKQINADGGVNGKKLALTALDDASNPSQAATQSRKLVDDDVAVVIGPTYTPAFLSVTPLLQQAKVPNLSLAGPATAADSNQEWVTKVIPSQDLQAAALLKQAVASYDAKEIAVIVEDSAYGNANLDTIEKAAEEEGVSEVSDVKIPTGASDATPQISKISKEVDAIIAVAANPLTVTILKALQQLGIEAPLVGSLGFGQVSAVEPAGNFKNVLQVPSFLNATQPLDYQEQFVADYKAEYGKDPTFNAAFGYDGVQLLKQALTNAEGESREKIWDGLTKISNLQGVIGTFNFDKDTHELYDVSTLRFMQWADGTYTNVE